ncbi:PREDICTED: phosphatidylcholine translocator ABCB4-like, partial [Amphimedon queenslandica]|uniref:ABC transmembrane type-1 domain-containing protein n=1 Tax=Amphimedon queenslandica TaxID=400682 RepID=A0AAN0IJ09_AMPQE
KEEEDGVIPEVSLLRIIKANSKEWWLIALGLLGSVILGFIYPVFALIFGEILDIFARPPSEILSGLHPWAGLFLGIGVVVGLGAFIRSLCLGIAGENLTARLRTWSFRTFLRQDMSWFDKEENSAGALTTKLSTDASLVQGATGSRLGTLVEISVAMLLSLIISFVYSWMLTLVLAGFIPVFMLAGFLQFRANAESIKSSTDSSTVAGKIVIESLVNIRTVTSLGIQSNFFQSYTNEIRGPYKRALIKSPVLGAAYGFSQGVLYLGYVVTFGFGAYQVTRQPGDIAHSTFSNIFVVFTAVIFGALGAGQASSFAPDYAKAKQSANRIFALLDREPAIDGYSEDGLKPGDLST